MERRCCWVVLISLHSVPRVPHYIKIPLHGQPHEDTVVSGRKSCPLPTEDLYRWLINTTSVPCGFQPRILLQRLGINSPLFTPPHPSSSISDQIDPMYPA